MILNIKRLKYFAFLFLLFLTVVQANAAFPSEQDGKLAVFVTWGDLNHTPANNVYVEVRGFVSKDRVERSFILQSPRAGYYEASIPPGVYNVFVSDESSLPQCKRVVIATGEAQTWTVKLVFDDVNSEK